MTEEEKPKVRKSKKVFYVGNGSYLVGLPAINMSMKEWNQYPKKLRDKGLGLDLYKVE